MGESVAELNNPCHQVVDTIACRASEKCRCDIEFPRVYVRSETVRFAQNPNVSAATTSACVGVELSPRLACAIFLRLTWFQLRCRSRARGTPRSDGKSGESEELVPMGE